MLAVLVSTCKHLSQQGGFQSDRIVKWACWRWPIALVRGVCAVGTPFDIRGGGGGAGGGGRLAGCARGLGGLVVVLAARAWWWCSRLGGLGGGARGLGGFWVSAGHGSASPSQGDGSPKMSHVISM